MAFQIPSIGVLWTPDRVVLQKYGVFLFQISFLQFFMQKSSLRSPTIQMLFSLPETFLPPLFLGIV